MPLLPEVQQRVLETLFYNDPNGQVIFMQMRELIKSGISPFALQVYFSNLLLQEISTTDSSPFTLEYLQEIHAFIDSSLYGESFIHTLLLFLNSNRSNTHHIHTAIISLISSLAETIHAEFQLQEEIILEYQNHIKQKQKYMDKSVRDRLNVQFQLLQHFLTAEFFELHKLSGQILIQMYQETTIKLLTVTARLSTQLQHQTWLHQLEDSFLEMIEFHIHDADPDNYYQLSKEFRTLPKRSGDSLY